MRLIVPVLLNCLLVLGVYLAEKYTPAKKLPYAAKQVIAGILFGGVSAFASSYGVNWLGAVVNVRDAAPLSAGLIFGAPAGIISGFIMAFTLSLDDFVISYFVGSSKFQTLPLLIYSMTKKKVTPDMYALSTLIIITIFALLLFSNIRSGREEERRKRKAAKKCRKILT